MQKKKSTKGNLDDLVARLTGKGDRHMQRDRRRKARDTERETEGKAGDRGPETKGEEGEGQGTEIEK